MNNQATGLKEESKNIPMHTALGISEERKSIITTGCADAIKEWRDNDDMQLKTDLMKLAVEKCQPESMIEAVLIGAIIESCLQHME